MNILDVLTGPWAIQPDTLLEIQAIYAAHARGERADLPAIEARLGRPLANEQKPYQVQDGVAIVDVFGVMAKRMNLFQAISGGTSTEIAGSQIRAAAADASVKAIILRFDTPGGTVDGTQAFGEIIREAATQKPVVAWVDNMAQSAGYWAASAADAIYVGAKTASLGSIGVVAIHRDISAAESASGIKTTEITAGQYKRIASEFGPLSDAGRAEMQAKVDALYKIFVDQVAQYRGISPEQVLAMMADGRIFLAAEAIDRSLADGFMSLDGLIAGLASGELPLVRRGLGTPPKPASAHAPQAAAPTPTQGDRAMDMATLRADHPDLVTALLEEGRQAGASDERARILGIEAQAAGLPGHEALVASLKADGKTTPEQAAVQVLSAERGALSSRAKAMHEDAPKAAPHAAAPKEESGTLNLDNLPIEDRCKAQWDASADLRAEFASLAAYTAFTKNQASGRARVLSK
jgi:signal peptide peptidase SppA